MKRYFAITLILFTGCFSLACKCGWNGNFINVAPYEDLVIKAKVIGHSKINSDIEEKMTIEVVKIFKGINKRKRITVIGDDGKSCRPYVSTFKKGNTYYLGLQKVGNDYEISVCGEYWLSINEGKVKMAKNKSEDAEPKPMNEKEFEELLKAEIKQ
jgi:hypothetical protein